MPITARTRKLARWVGALLMAALAAAPAAAQAPPSQPDPWVYGLEGTRVGDARPWLAETTTGAVGWVDADFLLYYIKHQPLTGLLITTGDATSLTGGALTDKSTSVLFGNNNLNMGVFPGGRISAGWQPDGAPFAVETSAFYLPPQFNRFAVASNANGNPLIAIPVNLFGVNETALRISDPGLFSGSVSTEAKSEMWGAEINGARDWITSPQSAVGMLLGFRFLDLRESFKLATNSMDTSDGNSQTSFDSFGTENRFYGVQLGARCSWRQDRLSISLFDKVGLGITDEHLTINGMRSGASTACSCLSTAGFLTTPSSTSGIFTSSGNSGKFDRDSFGVIDEVGINLTFEIFENVAATMGYSFLFWSDVVRPGNQINRVVAPDGVTPPAVAIVPGPLNRTSTFWAQGVSFGLEFRY